MKRSLAQLFTFVVIASIWGATASTALAQDKSAPRSSDKTVVVSDSVSVEDVQKAAQQLADAVEAAVRKATEDPAVKVAALKVAKNAVTAAQVAITQQTQTLQAVLDALSREIAMATDKQQSKAKTH